METQKIKGLQDKQTVETYFLVKDKNVGLGKNGRPFMSVLLGDDSGTLDGRLWDRVDETSKEFEIGDIVKIKGLVQSFQNRLQLVIHKLEKPEQQAFNLEDYLPKVSKKVEDLFAELVTIVRGVENDFLRQLMMDVLEDPEIKPKLLKAPAARSIHHAWLGGLLEHIVSIAQLMNFMGQHYSFLNKDLLIFGALFHDLGKIWELSYDNGIRYTDRGRLIGHMMMSFELVEKKASRIFGFPEELKDICKHIILSHHGKLEYGSPKRPKTMEALMVAMIDELDSKVASAQSFIEAERVHGEKWSRLNDQFERYFLLDDMNQKWKPS